MYTAEELEAALPRTLRAVVREDTHFWPRALSVSNAFVAWFEASGTPFFRNYTDHTHRHSFDVFASAVELIAADTVDSGVVSAKDLGFLLVACFCHDAGMHLTERQFKTLISNDRPPLCSDFDSLSWRQLWIDFGEEVTRWNGAKLNDVFGDFVPAQMPPDDLQMYNERHRLLVGEFLRRHHPRFAYDLISGLAPELYVEAVASPLTLEERQLVGYIARSHGLPLRATLDTIERHFHIRDYGGLHAVYVMSLLRLADYVQIQSARAPALYPKIHTISSPISQREWRVHQCVRNITKEQPDPEAIYVDGAPQNVSDYLRLRDWLTDIQQELDVCWAVLGEVYGRFGELRRLQVRIRRIRSSIADGRLRTTYVPDEFRFRVAEAEMLSLLLKPLYGDHPGYGVRELLQNAVDAARERNVLENPEQRPWVKISVNFIGEKGSVSISDTGIGMEVRTIRDFFLNAGASFRSSPEWQASFVDKEGQPRVTRTGRFGVGALAAFLIGPRISVATRYYTSESGYRFNASLNDKQIEVTKDTTLPVGTNITIEVFPHNRDQICEWIGEMGQYFQFSPDVEVLLVSNIDGTPSTLRLNRASKPFRHFETAKYDSVQLIRHATRALPDYVNGIAVSHISKGGSYFRSATLGHIFASYIQQPTACGTAVQPFDARSFSVVIHDKSGLAPLNLARTDFTERDPDILEKFFEFGFGELVQNTKLLIRTYNAERFDRVFYKVRINAFVFFAKGICLTDYDVMNGVGARRILRFRYLDVPSRTLVQTFQHYGVIFGNDYGRTSRTELVSRIRDIKLLPRSDYVSLYLCIEKQFAVSALGLSNVPAWARELIGGATVLVISGREYVLICFGEEDLQAKADIIASAELSGSRHCECIVSRRWIARDYERSRISRAGVFAHRWMRLFRSSAGMLGDDRTTKSADPIGLHI